MAEDIQEIGQEQIDSKGNDQEHDVQIEPDAEELKKIEKEEIGRKKEEVRLQAEQRMKEEQTRQAEKFMKEEEARLEAEEAARLEAERIKK